MGAEADNSAGGGPRIAVVLPCYNEEAAIARTVAGFREALPQATVYVFDNNSRDRTIAAAKAAGAVVRSERMQGKGHVVRRMFADIEADVYVMADGDATYDAVGGAGDGPAPARRTSRHGGRRARLGGRRRLSPRSSLGQSSAHRHSRPAVRPQLFRHPVGLPRYSHGASSNPFRCCRRASRSRPRSASTPWS